MTEVNILLDLRLNILAKFFFYLFFWNDNKKDGAKKGSLLNSLRQASQRA